MILSKPNVERRRAAADVPRVRRSMGSSRRRRSIVVILVCCLAIFMTTMDNTVLIVALPTLRRELGASTAELQWSVSSYLLARAALLFTAAAIADRYGRRRCFAIGLVVFVAGSLACALSVTAVQLILFRAIQAIGGTLMTPASMGLLANYFRSPVRRAQALGIWSAATGVSTTLGPLVGGALIEAVNWQSIFLINIPVGLLALVGLRWVPESKELDRRARMNVVGQVCVAVGLAAMTFGFISAPEQGWGSYVVIGAFVAAVAFAAGFVLTERRSDHPLIRVRPGRAPMLTGSVVVAVVTYIGVSSFTFFSALYLQEVRGHTPLIAGLLAMPVTVATIVLGPLSGIATGRWGARFPTVLACVLVAAGLGSLAVVVTPTTPVAVLLGCFVVLGLGYGIVNPPLANSAVVSMPAEASGVAAAATSTARQIGHSLGVVLIGAIVFGIAGPDTTSREAFTGALRWGWGAAALICLVGAVVPLWAFRRRPADPDVPDPVMKSPVASIDS